MDRRSVAAGSATEGEGLDPGAHTAASPQERVEASAAGRWALSAMLVVTLAALVAWNLPAGSELRTVTLPLSEPYINATGLTQTWNLFAPDPLSRTREFEARIHYPDGTSTSWQAPRGGPGLAQYRTYRWYAQMARLRLDSSQERWKPFVEWLVKVHDHRGRQPDRVDLIRRWRDVAPSPDTPDGSWQEETFFTLDLYSEPTR